MVCVTGSSESISSRLSARRVVRMRTTGGFFGADHDAAHARSKRAETAVVAGNERGARESARRKTHGAKRAKKTAGRGRGLWREGDCRAEKVRASSPRFLQRGSAGTMQLRERRHLGGSRRARFARAITRQHFVQPSVKFFRHGMFAPPLDLDDVSRRDGGATTASLRVSASRGLARGTRRRRRRGLGGAGFAGGRVRGSLWRD